MGVTAPANAPLCSISSVSTAKTGAVITTAANPRVGVSYNLVGRACSMHALLTSSPFNYMALKRKSQRVVTQLGPAVGAAPALLMSGLIAWGGGH
jgi:hypothetical protein